MKNLVVWFQFLLKLFLLSLNHQKGKNNQTNQLNFKMSIDPSIFSHFTIEQIY